MSQLTLISSDTDSLRPFVQGALDREADLLETSIEKTKKRIRDFEARYQLSTEEFLECYRENKIQETLETIEWVGESRMLTSLQESLRTLRGIQIED